jgi:hypothetical protein
MRNFNENSITGAVLDRIQDVGNSRVGQISKALVRHLHAFVREVRPTQAEWEQGYQFPHPHRKNARRQASGVYSVVGTLGMSMPSIAACRKV